MHDRKVYKKFPKSFHSYTSTGDEGYLKNRRLSPEERSLTAIKILK